MLPRHVAAAHISRCDSHLLLGSFPPMLQADPCKPGSWWLFGILGCGSHRKRQNKDAPNSACLSGSVPAAVAVCLHHCLPSLCLSAPSSLSTSLSPGLSVSLSDKLCCVTSGKLLFLSEPQFPHLDTRGGVGSAVSTDLPRLTVQWGLPGSQPPAPLPWASLCSSGPRVGGQVWGYSPRIPQP